MPVNVGDAVLTFVGDSSQLDQTFDSLPAKAEAGMQPIIEKQEEVQAGFQATGVAAEEAGQKISISMRQSTEQVRFLSEEVGVRLPRAMARVVSQVPGLSGALSAAFQVTAIVFALELLDSLTKKFADWVFGVKDSTKDIIEWNKTMEEQAAALKKVQEQLANFGLSADDLARKKIQGLVDEMNKQGQAAASAAQEMEGFRKVFGATAETQARYIQLQSAYVTAVGASKIATDQFKLAVEELHKTESDDAKRKADKEEEEAIQGIIRYQTTLNDIQERYNKQVEELDKTLLTVSKDFKEITPTIATPAAVQQILDMRKAAQELGITLRSDLQQKLNEARIAKDLFVTTMGTKDVQQIKLFDEAIIKAEKDLKNFSTGSKVVETAWSHLSKELSKDSEEMATDLGAALEGALTGTQKVGQMLEKQTISMIASLCKQWGVYYVAKGIAIDADPTTAGAGTGLIVEGLALEALAGAITAAGSQIGGGKSGNSNTGVSQLGVGSNTSGSGVSGGTSVRGFAAGGLVSSPTLAYVAERPGSTEAVLPLDDPAALGRIGEALAHASGGRGSTTNFNIKGGIMSPDTVAKMARKMNNMTKRGQLTLYSSNSLRVNRRSA